MIDVNGLSIGKAADMLAVSRLTSSKIANGKGAITLNIALRIEQAFGCNADFWLRMQRGYDLIEEKIKFEKNPPNIKRFTV